MRKSCFKLWLFLFYLASKLILNTEILTKNIYESMMPIHPMTQHQYNKFGENMMYYTQHDKKIKGMNKKPNHTTFERKEGF